MTSGILNNCASPLSPPLLRGGRGCVTVSAAPPNILAKAPVVCGDHRTHRLKPEAIQNSDCDARLHLPPTPSTRGGGVVLAGMAVSDSINKGMNPLAACPLAGTGLYRRYHNTPPTPSQEGRASASLAVSGCGQLSYNF
jgi:hypothetical protein